MKIETISAVSKNINHFRDIICHCWPINNEISQISFVHKMPAMHLIKFPGRVHDFRHFWLGATMGDTRGPQTPASSIIHIFWQRVAGPCPGPVCNFDMKFFFLLLFLCMPFFFFLNLRQVFLHIPNAASSHTYIYLSIYNIDVLLLGHFLRLKSLHVQFSTDTPVRDICLHPSQPPFSRNSQHNSGVFGVHRHMYGICTNVAGSIGRHSFPGARKKYLRSDRPTR